MARAVIERKDPPQRRDGACLYELWELGAGGRRVALHGSVPVAFRRGNPDPGGARAAKRDLRARALSAGLDVAREDP